MDQIQVQDVLNKLKEQIGELTYQIIYRDAVIEVLQKQMQEMEQALMAQGQQEKVDVEIMEPRD